MKSNFVEEPHPKPRPGQTQRCACLWLPHPALDHEITARCIAILNRADPEALIYDIQYYIGQCICDLKKGENCKLAKEFGQGSSITPGKYYWATHIV